MSPTIVERMKKATHAQMLLRLRAAQAEHPQPDAPTKAAYIQAYYAADDLGTPVHTGEYFNVVPAPLRRLNAKDQLLDADYADQYPEDQRPPKMRQASPTAHAETLAQMEYVPEVITAEAQGKKLFKIGYVNQMPCPRCMSNLALGGVNVLVIDNASFDNEWMARRWKYADMSLEIAEAAGIRVIEMNPQSLEMTVWTDGMPDRQDANGFYEIAPEEMTKYSLEELMCKYHSSTPELNRYTHYMAAARIGSSGLYIGEPILSPGIDNGKYCSKLRAEETKYSFTIPPVTALLIRLQRQGINPAHVTIETSDVPCMRDIVNAVAAGVRQIRIAAPHQLIAALATHEINGREKHHDSTHAEAGADKKHMVYDQLSALKILQRELGDGLVLTPKQDAPALQPS